MRILRSIALGILTPILTILLFATALDIGAVRIVADPSAVKQVLATSGLYTTIVPNALQQVPAVQTAVGAVAPSNQLIKQAATAAITPRVVQTDIESMINGTYRWLDGTTPLPNFAIDLSGVKTTLATNIASSIEQHLATLPACTTGAATTQFNALTATCLPPHVTPAAAATTVSDGIVQNPGFLSQSTITAANIKDANSAQSIFQTKLRQFPAYYRRLKQTPFIFAGLTALTAVGVVYLSRSVRRGLRHVGLTMLTVGVALFGLAWLLSRFLPTHVLPHLTVPNNVVLQQALQKLAAELLGALSRSYVLIGVIYAVVGMGLFITPWLIRRSATMNTAKEHATESIVLTVPASRDAESPSEESSADKPADAESTPPAKEHE